MSIILLTMLLNPFLPNTSYTHFLLRGWCLYNLHGKDHFNNGPCPSNNPRGSAPIPWLSRGLFKELYSSTMISTGAALAITFAVIDRYWQGVLFLQRCPVFDISMFNQLSRLQKFKKKKLCSTLGWIIVVYIFQY